MGKLTSLRQEIDAIDNRIIELLGKRGRIAKDIGEEKERANLPNLHSPLREEEIFRRLAERNKGPYPQVAIRTIFREIFSATLALQTPLKVAFLGPEATFSHLAAQKTFGKSTGFMPVRSIPDIFLEVEKKSVEYGIAPIENSAEGVIGHTLDLLVDSPLNIVGEKSLEISIHLLTSHGDISKVSKIYSHPHAIAQCKGWIEKNLPNAVVEGKASTAAAAELAGKDETVGALANEMAAESYDLKITARNIQDRANHLTRFVVISNGVGERSGKDKTSIVFSVQDAAGALVNCLNILSDGGINMNKIESRPAKKKAWEYLFFVDLDGHAQDEPVGRALEQIKETCSFFKLLGSYPKGG